MKLTITKKDIQYLNGKFIVQIDSKDPDTTIMDGNWGFWKEKRISLVADQNLVGFYYIHNSFDTPEAFLEYFNNYGDGKRFHRLLTARELDYMFDKLKQENH